MLKATGKSLCSTTKSWIAEKVTVAFRSISFGFQLSKIKLLIVIFSCGAIPIFTFRPDLNGNSIEIGKYPKIYSTPTAITRDSVDFVRRTKMGMIEINLEHSHLSFSRNKWSSPLEALFSKWRLYPNEKWDSTSGLGSSISSSIILFWTLDTCGATEQEETCWKWLSARSSRVQAAIMSHNLWVILFCN